LAKTAASHHGVYFTHIRNEGRELLPSVEEAIQIGREAHIPVHIYHLKAAGQENWSLFGAALKLIEKARDSRVPQSFAHAANDWVLRVAGTQRVETIRAASQ